ncbi:RING finger protein [Colletotrichum graminicola]|nr:RING finger protein [Colletotrichum graminicola]
MWTWLKKWRQDDKPANQKQQADCLPPPQAPPPVQERAQGGCKHPTRLPKRIANAIHGFVKGYRPQTNPVAEMAEAAEKTKSACVATVLAIFPDICTDFLQETAFKFQHNSEQTIDEILRLFEMGKQYPKRSYSNALKRKRETSEDPDEEANIRRTYEHPNRGMESNPEYLAITKQVLKHEFPDATISGIGKVLASKSNQLLPAYVAIDIAISELRRGSRENIPEGFSSTKRSRPATENKYDDMQLDRTIETTNNPDEKRALQELQAARKLRSKRIKAYLDSAQEKLNFAKALADGNVVECGCCFGELARNRAVCCQNLENPHLFCVDCARRAAEHAVGQSKYELICMSMDQCKAGFSREQRQKFLSDQLSAALDRIENAAILRMAGIENLETCPFCPYAAEYPPIDTNREFRCDNPDCRKVSCRHCKEDTHLPKTCEEAARDKDIGARHEIEEAMSAALIRKCNKCGTPFIKEMGCNKMACTAANCRNIQCYVCSKSCDYSHFDDKSRGGKVGNCPLFDVADVRVRHESEVKAAEDKARKKVLESNHRVDRDFLKFDMPEDKPRRPRDPPRNQRPAGHHSQGQPPPRVVQAPPVQVAQQSVAAMPVVGQNVFGQLPGDNLHLWPALPQQYQVPGQVANQAGFPARPPAEYRGHPGMAGGLDFPAPQYQSRLQQPQPQAVVMPGALNMPYPLNMPFFNQQNPNQLQPVGPALPFGPVNGASPRPAPAPRELKRQNHCNKGSRRPANNPGMPKADVQPVHLPQHLQVERQGHQMNEGQLSPRPQTRPSTGLAPNPNNQAAQQYRNLAANQHAQLAPDDRQPWEALQARLQARDAERAQQQAQNQKQATGDQQVRQTPDQSAIVQASHDRDMSTRWRESMTVPKRIEPRRAIQGEPIQEEESAMDIQERANRGVNRLNPNPPKQPPAPDRPNWLMPAGPQGVLTRLAPMRQKAAAAGAAGSSDEPLELD